MTAVDRYPHGYPDYDRRPLAIVVDVRYGRHHRSSVVFPYLITVDPSASSAIKTWARLVMDRKGRKHTGCGKHRAAEVAA